MGGPWEVVANGRPSLGVLGVGSGVWVWGVSAAGSPVNWGGVGESPEGALGCCGAGPSWRGYCRGPCHEGTLQRCSGGVLMGVSLPRRCPGAVGSDVGSCSAERGGPGCGASGTPWCCCSRMMSGSGTSMAAGLWATANSLWLGLPRSRPVPWGLVGFPGEGEPGVSIPLGQRGQLGAEQHGPVPGVPFSSVVSSRCFITSMSPGLSVVLTLDAIDAHQICVILSSSELVA